VNIGEFYRVPAVRVDDWSRYSGWLPVIGPMHEDAEIVGFHWQHFHIDWRFVSERLWRYWRDFPKAGSHFGRPLQCPDTRGQRVILEGPVLRRLKCKRDPGVFPRYMAKWVPALEAKFACARITNGVCPHRGIPVSAMHREGDVLTCPGHGLQWNALTGLPHVSINGDGE